MSLEPILFLDASPIYGGAQRSLFSLIRELHSRGENLSLVCSCDELVAACGETGIPAEKLDLSAWTKSLMGALKATTDMLRFRQWLGVMLSERDVRAVYANGIQSGLLARFCLPDGLPFIFHHRDIRCPEMAFKQVAAAAARTVVLSEYMAMCCRRQLHSDVDLIPVYNGFDFVAMEQQAKESLPWDVEASIVLVADMVKWKRHDLLLRALAALRDKKGAEETALVIGGARDAAGESWFTELRQLCEELGLEKVVFAGSVPNAVPYIARCSVLCSVADGEPFGRTIIEAGALGKPMVIAGEGGPREITKGLDNVIAAVAAPEEVAEALAEALKLPETPPSADWKTTFSIQQHADRIAELILTLTD